MVMSEINVYVYIYKHIDIVYTCIHVVVCVCACGHTDIYMEHNILHTTSENRQSVHLVVRPNHGSSALHACRSRNLGLGQSRWLRLQRFGYLMGPGVAGETS